jgi:regulatory protein
LTTQGFDQDVIEETIQKGEAAGLLDDRLFAKLWVEDRLLYHPLSRRAVARELAEKGIAPEIANELLEERYPPEKEKEIVLKLAQTRLARYQNLDRDRRIRRTVAFLTRKGFNTSLATRVVRSVIERLSDREIGKFSN